ncbi:MAG TPA: chitosanase [Phycisphaerae bacterium]|nr:chitosanase [Phycisphaerae bacterium]
MAKRMDASLNAAAILLGAGSRDGADAGLRDSASKEIAMQLVSAAENSSLDWKAQYGYIEYNVEKNYLNAFLHARKAAMRTEEGHRDTTRVDTMQRVFVQQENWDLHPPLHFKVYGDTYFIDGK